MQDMKVTRGIHEELLKEIATRAYSDIVAIIFALIDQLDLSIVSDDVECNQMEQDNNLVRTVHTMHRQCLQSIANTFNDTEVNASPSSAQLVAKHANKPTDQIIFINLVELFK